jgi:hypothetical protein
VQALEGEVDADTAELRARQRLVVGLAEEPANVASGVHEQFCDVDVHLALQRLHALDVVPQRFERVAAAVGHGRILLLVGPVGHLAAVLGHRLGVGLSPNRVHRVRHFVRRGSPVGLRVGFGVGVRAAEEREEVPLLVVAQVESATHHVGGVAEFPRREVGVVERSEVAAADEPALADVLASDLARAVRDLSERPSVHSLPDLGQVELDRRVGVESALLLDADAPEAPAVGALDAPRLVVGPPRPTVLALALAANFHTEWLVAATQNTVALRGVGGDQSRWNVRVVSL